MTIYWYDSNRIDPITFPLSLGTFAQGEAPNRLIWFYSDSTLSNLHIKIEKISDNSWKAFQLAKDFLGRPQTFNDYLGELYYDLVAANIWTSFWIKFQPEKLVAQDDFYSINLRMTGEILAS